MKIQYCSDLHLEFAENRAFIKNNPIKPVGEVLILAGDIVPLISIDKHKDFFDYVSENFSVTYWVPGNHEYYGYDLLKKTKSFQEEIRDNVFLLNNRIVTHKGVRLILSTLWSHISPPNELAIQQDVSDFHVIKYGRRKLSVFEFNKFHSECVEFLTNALQENTIGKTIVVTHHVPTLINYPEKYRDSFLNEAFVEELSSLIEACRPDYWIYGHHHTNTPSFKIGETQMLTNQIGYVALNEHDLYKHDAIILFDTK
jgi:predicted phosphohydrolase